MASVFITGATGFIGYHLAKALQAQGDDVTCLRANGSGIQRLESLGVTLAHGDVTDRKSLRAGIAGSAIVYHVAGCVMTTRVKRFYEVNAEGTQNVAAICAEQPDPPILVVVSSLAAAGPSPAARFRTESDPPCPVSEYGRSKLAGEIGAQAFADRVPITVVRPPIVLGHGDKKGLDLFRSIDRYRCHMVPGWRDCRYSLIHVTDLVHGIILAAQRGRRLVLLGQEEGPSAAVGCYFLASREHPTYAELGYMVKAELNRRYAPVLRLPLPMVWLIASSGEAAGRLRGRPFYFNFDKYREVAAGSWTCSIQRATDELGFSVGAPLAERLRQTIQWYRSERWL